MNRRNFLNSILIAGASFSILPGAGRIWRVQRELPDDTCCIELIPRAELQEWLDRFVIPRIWRNRVETPVFLEPGNLDTREMFISLRQGNNVRSLVHYQPTEAGLLASKVEL